MEMCCGMALRMPSNYVMLNKEEMTYLEGGVSLSVNTHMLDKNYCLSIATNYTLRVGLGRERIAQEIYAHAYLYYGGLVAQNTFLANFPGGKSVLNYILTHSNPIDLGGDSALRVAAYKAIWNFI